MDTHVKLCDPIYSQNQHFFVTTSHLLLLDVTSRLAAFSLAFITR